VWAEKTTRGDEKRNQNGGERTTKKAQGWPAMQSTSQEKIGKEFTGNKGGESLRSLAGKKKKVRKDLFTPTGGPKKRTEGNKGTKKNSHQKGKASLDQTSNGS